MLLLNAVWFFDISINANTDVWLRERGKRLFLGILTFVSCATSTFMLSLQFQSKIVDPADALSSIDLLVRLFCRLRHYYIAMILVGGVTRPLSTHGLYRKMVVSIRRQMVMRRGKR